jgi:hypothetical protein
MRTLDAIALRLEEHGIAVGGTTLFVGSDVDIPEGGGPYVSLNETGGRAPIGLHNSKSLRRPNIQVTVRGEYYPVVGDLVDRAFVALGGEQGLSNIQIGDIFFLTMRPTSEPYQLTNDALQRVRLAFNVATMRR